MAEKSTYGFLSNRRLLSRAVILTSRLIGHTLFAEFSSNFKFPERVVRNNYSPTVIFMAGIGNTPFYVRTLCGDFGYCDYH